MLLIASAVKLTDLYLSKREEKREYLQPVGKRRRRNGVKSLFLS